MSQENVVSFEASVRRAMARRGSPDKSRSAEILDVPCPYCGVVLSVKSGFLALRAEVLCESCRTVIDLGNREIVEGRS